MISSEVLHSQSAKTKKTWEKPKIKQIGNLADDFGIERIGPNREIVKLPDNVISFLKETYPGELSFLDESRLSPQLTEVILDRFRLNTIDPGLLADSKFIEEDGSEIVAKGVPVMNRPSFVHKNLQEITDEKSQHTDKEMSILVGDISRLRQADLVKDNTAEENSYADILLNKVANEIYNVIIDFMQENDDLKDDFKVYFGRYGGDEFVVSIVGQLDQKKKDLLAKKIRDSLLLNIEGRYINGDEIEVGPIGLKGGKMDQIDIPNNPTEKRVFLHYFKRGLIFDTDQINKTLDKFRNPDTGIDEERLNNYLQKEEDEYHIYPDNVTTLKEKANYIASISPKLGLVVAAAMKYDSDNGNSTNSAIGVLKVVENIIFDPLLREHILTFTEIFDNLKKGRYSELHVFDLKFIKEINDNLGLVDGDLAIKQMWIQLKSKISDKDRKKIDFGRRGGTYFLTIKEGEAISEETSQLLEGFEFATILSDQDTDISGVNVPIGKSKIDVSKLIDINDLKDRLDHLFNNVDESWYEKIFNYINLIDTDKAKNSDTLDFRNLLYKFLSGKRRAERQKVLIDVINKKVNDKSRAAHLIQKLVSEFK